MQFKIFTIGHSSNYRFKISTPNEYNYIIQPMKTVHRYSRFTSAASASFGLIRIFWICAICGKNVNNTNYKYQLCCCVTSVIKVWSCGRNLEQPRSRLTDDHKLHQSDNSSMSIVRWAFRVGSWQPTEQDWMKVTRFIQAEEKERIGRFVFKRDAKSSMAGRLLIRKFVSESTSIRYSEIKLDRDDRGKPFLVSPHNWPVQFNVSHQGEFAVLAGVNDVAKETHRIGVDVMKVEYSGGKSQEEFFRIMGRNFSPKEWSTIRGAGGAAERLTSFCRHWSLKESYVKATGTGITVNLQDISFEPASPLTSNVVTDTRLYVQNKLVPEWTFEESLVDSQHCVSVARNFLSDAYKFYPLSFQDLTNCCEPLLPEDAEYCSNFFTKDERP